MVRGIAGTVGSDERRENGLDYEEARLSGRAFRMQVAPTQNTCLLRQHCMNLSIPMTVRRTAISVSRLAAPRRSDSLPKILWIDKTGPFCGFQRETYPTGLQTDMKDILPPS